MNGYYDVAVTKSADGAVNDVLYKSLCTARDCGFAAYVGTAYIEPVEIFETNREMGLTCYIEGTTLEIIIIGLVALGVAALVYGMSVNIRASTKYIATNPALSIGSMVLMIGVAVVGFMLIMSLIRSGEAAAWSGKIRGTV